MVYRISNQFDVLLGQLIGLAKVTDGNEHLICPSCTELIAEVLDFIHSAGADADLAPYSQRIEEEKWSLVPDCRLCASPCGRHRAYDMAQLHSADPEIRDLKYLLLEGICKIAACLRRWSLLGKSAALDRFLYTALIVVGLDDYSLQDLLPILRTLGAMEKKCADLMAEALG